MIIDSLSSQRNWQNDGGDADHRRNAREDAEGAFGFVFVPVYDFYRANLDFLFLVEQS